MGEFALINRLTKELKNNSPSTLLGVGDDAAIIDPLGKRVVVIALPHLGPNPLFVSLLPELLWD